MVEPFQIADSWVKFDTKINEHSEVRDLFYLYYY